MYEASYRGSCHRLKKPFRPDYCGGKLDIFAAGNGRSEMKHHVNAVERSRKIATNPKVGGEHVNGALPPRRIRFGADYRADTVAPLEQSFYNKSTEKSSRSGYQNPQRINSGRVKRSTRRATSSISSSGIG